MKALFAIEVDIADCHSLHSAKGGVNMVNFTGRCESELFCGRILSGGVDTQYALKARPGTLSARYMLEGVDDQGHPARIFIENSAVQGEPYTHPRILTDAPRLAWLEDAKLLGRIEGRTGGVRVTIYQEE